MVWCFNSVLSNPPAVGSIITVKHAGNYANGKLKQPIFWRERKDILWNDLSHEQQVFSSPLVFCSICYRILKHFSPQLLMYGQRKKTTEHFLCTWETSLVFITQMIGINF